MFLTSHTSTSIFVLVTRLVDLPFIILGRNSENNSRLRGEVNVRALKGSRADSAGGLGTTVHTYKSELDWGGAR